MSHPTQAPLSLRSDTHGAVMIMAVFMAMIAIGALYFLVGLGDALLAQERMQDAADATAFSSAVIHARGMNILALINIIMAAVLAIAVLLSILGSVLKVGAIAAAVASFFTLGSTAPLAKALTAKAKVVHDLQGPVEKTVSKVLRIGHGLQGPLSTAIPMIAGLNAYTLSSQHYGPVVSGGTTFPIYGSLPTVDGKFDKLCEKAGEYAGDMAVFPIAAILESFGGDWLADKLSSLADKAATTYAKYYCGDGEMPEPPTIKVDIALPELSSPERIDCEKGGPPDDACEKYAALKQEVAERYDVESTGCPQNDPDDYCLQNRRRAREQCLPTNRPKVKKTVWVKRDAEHFYRIEGTGDDRRVVKDIRDAPDGTKRPDGIQRASGVLMDGKSSKTAASIPCRLPGGSFQKAGDFGAFIVTNFTEWEFDPALPLCTEEFDPPSVADFGGNDAMSIIVTEVADILSCDTKKEVKSPLPEKRLDDEMKNQTPQEMCNCAALGEDMFQIRSVVFGDAKEYTGKSDSRVLVATLGEQAPSTTIGQIASVVGRMAAAQAEYYFESEDPEVQANPGEWLWHMSWKARMRRLRLSGKAWECPEETNTCERKAGTLGKLVGDQVLKVNALTELLKEGADAVIVH